MKRKKNSHLLWGWLASRWNI